MMTYELDDIELEVLLGVVIETRPDSQPSGDNDEQIQPPDQ